MTEQARLVPSDGEPGDQFGRVAMDGDVIVEAFNEDNVGNNVNQGSAYVFVEPPGGWSGTITQSAKLTASDGASDDIFGLRVAVHGDVVVVCGPLRRYRAGRLRLGLRVRQAGGGLERQPHPVREAGGIRRRAQRPVRQRACWSTATPFVLGAYFEETYSAELQARARRTCTRNPPRAGAAEPSPSPPS